MPLYQYHCQACGKNWEKRIPIKYKDAISCPDCGAKPDIVISPILHYWKNGKPN